MAMHFLVLACAAPGQMFGVREVCNEKLFAAAMSYCIMVGLYISHSHALFWDFICSARTDI